VLDEHATLEDGDVRRITVDVHVHLEPTDGPALALAATPSLEGLLVEFDRRLAGDQTLDRRRLVAALTATARGAATLTVALLAGLLTGLLALLLATATGTTAAAPATSTPAVA
jgi:hypothetical protein